MSTSFSEWVLCTVDANAFKRRFYNPLSLTEINRYAQSSLAYINVILIYVTITKTSQWARWLLKSPDSRLFTQLYIQAKVEENIKAPCHWPLCGEFTGDRRIPRTKGQLRGKFFHLMTSSCKLGEEGDSSPSVFLLGCLCVNSSPFPEPSRQYIARFMGPTWGTSGADRTKVAPCWPMNFVIWEWTRKNTLVGQCDGKIWGSLSCGQMLTYDLILQLWYECSIIRYLGVSYQDWTVITDNGIPE